MTVLLTLTTAGSDTGPFDLYSNLDGYTVPFETGVAKADLQSGYISGLVPDYTNVVRVKSNGICINHTDIPLVITGLVQTLARGTSNTDACLNANSL